MIPDIQRQLGPAAYAEFEALASQLSSKHRRNKIRADYYDMHNLFEDLGIAIPPALRDLEVAMGWPAKAVDLLARRIRLAGFVLPGGNLEEFGIPELIEDNGLLSLAAQATTSSLIHATSFILTSKDEQGRIGFSVHDATSATGRWGRRGLRSALVKLASDEAGQTTNWLFLTDVSAANIIWEGNQWAVQIHHHELGRVPLEPLVYHPRPGRRFGSSRISRAVMYFTDSAMRTAARSEVGAEFFSAPQRYLLGADEDAFEDADGTKKSTWDLVMGRILTYPEATTPDGADIKIGQFPQVSMQPHADQFRMWAALFAGETSLPLSSLGIVQDNPSSAEAIFAAKEDLVIEAEGCTQDFSSAWTRTLATAVQWRDNLAEPPAELKKLTPVWRDPSTPSRAQAADAVIKEISAGVLPADSDVALERLGYDPATITRIKEHRANSAPTGIDALAQAMARQGQ